MVLQFLLALIGLGGDALGIKIAAQTSATTPEGVRDFQAATATAKTGHNAERPNPEHADAQHHSGTTRSS